MKKLTVFVALVLVLAVLLTGCGVGEILRDVYALLTVGTAASFDEMEYVRPDVDEFQRQLAVCMDGAPTMGDVDDYMVEIFALYELYYDYYTNYYLADLHYCMDMTDIYWEKEYNWFLESSSEVDAGMDQLLYTLADSPMRKGLEAEDYFGAGFFDDYQGDSLYDETFTALAAREDELLGQYYALSAQTTGADYYSEEFAAGCGAELEAVYVELIRVRQEMAAYSGYENYPQFAYDFYYYRDYTPEQAAEYVDQIRQELTPLYTELDPAVWDVLYESCGEAETFAYVQECAQAVGGTAAYAFELMEKAGLYDISYSANKYDASFEVYLYSYYVPFIFVDPSGMAMDKLTFVHEFGHFCSDYAASGSIAGVDVAEIFSQGMEYLSLCYCAGTEELTGAKMADSLCTFVEQAAYAAFEHSVYGLEGDELTAENVRALYVDTMNAYGVPASGLEYVLVPHFYIAPMYVISYVVSNDAAMQIYQAELAEAGGGLALWEENLDTEESYFLAFLEEAGLDSPFEAGRVQELRVTFEEILG